MHPAIALLLLTASPAPAPAETLIIVIAPEQPKKICRPGAATGTRVTKNICRTQTEWEAMQSPHFNKSDAYFNNGRSGTN